MKLNALLSLAFIAPALPTRAEPAVQPEFQYTILIAKPAGEVWNALTQKAIVDRYHLAPLMMLELKKGGSICYGGDCGALISGTVLEAEAPKKLAHTFRFARSKDAETTVSYEIAQIGEQMWTRVSKTDKNADGLVSKEELRSAFADRAGGGDKPKRPEGGDAPKKEKPAQP